MNENCIALRNLAHLGDAVWELFVREYTIQKTTNIKKLHNITTERVNAFFQNDMLELIIPILTEEELELVRRARNLPIPVARRNIQKQYRQATAFETLLGFWHLYNKERLIQIFERCSNTTFFN